MAPYGIIIADLRRRGDRRLLADYGYIAILFIVAVTVPLLIVLLYKAIAVKPKQPDYYGAKEDTYECGMETQGRSWVQFNFRYYFYALLLIALDVLAIFLYPWAAGFRDLGMFGFVAIFERTAF